LEGIPISAKLLGRGHIAAEFAPAMKSRFQLDEEFAPVPTPALIDPDAFDVSEQQFAASLQEKSAHSQPQFVPDDAEPPAKSRADDDSAAAVNQQSAGEAAIGAGSDNAQAAITEATVCQPTDPDQWRREVAARVNHYRGKRPRAPRYPSLQLRFEPGELAPFAQSEAPTPMVASRGQLAITMDVEPLPSTGWPVAHSTPDVPIAAPPDGAAKILAFPRSPFMPSVVLDELAEPVFERPRILEVPEVLPPPPALGGILIDPAQEPQDERRPGFELPLKSAPLSRRILAGMTDALVVAAAFSAFAYIFFRVTAIVPPLRQGVSVAAALLALFWVAYQYLLLVHAGSTPGLKLAKLELSRFDGSAVPRRLRRWRVLASALSGLSLALGYAWCFMDEDELCWHDRITHTYMAPKAGKAAPVSASH
jgi:uncharacterized RDD family membrane protein YckC